MRIFLVVSLFCLVCGSLSAQKTITLSGIVRDSVSGEVIIGATIRLFQDSISAAKPLRGAYSNKFGFFSIPKLVKNSYVMTVGYFGYRTFVKKMTVQQLDTLTQLSILLSRKEIIAEEVVVTSQRNDNNPAENISRVTVQSDFIKDMPALLGETDIFRVLQLLPGVKSPSELSSGLYVRGGSPDQNLILLDGVTIYNPAHLGGFLSTFNADALREVTLIKGGFPAEFGGRLSSVLDLTMKDVS